MAYGYLIVFEGIDGSGTTTQSHLLARHLAEAGLEVTWTREPGGTPVAEQIRQVVLDPNVEGICPPAEFFLYAASRSQHIHEVIAPAMERGEVVVCDRYTASSVAYQGYGRGVDLDLIDQVNRLTVGRYVPDLTLYLLLPTAVAWDRVRHRSEKPDRIEQAGLALQEKVEAGYRTIAHQDSRGGSWVFDAQVAIPVLAQHIREVISQEWSYLTHARQDNPELFQRIQQALGTSP